MFVGPRSKKFNIVSDNHGRTQKCDFCISVCKINFTDHHKLLQYTILEIRFWSLKCTTVTVRRKLEHFFSFPSGMQAIAMVYEIKALQNALNLFSTTYIYSNCISIILLLKNNFTNICSKKSKTEIN